MVTRKRPWNRINIPVYSLSTRDEAKGNMNICTYVTAVSLESKTYAISVYKETKTLENIQKNKRAILQFLGKQHVTLVNRLGKQSGFKRDKLKRLQPQLSYTNGLPYLNDALAILELEIIQLIDVGDHILAIAKVVNYKNNTDGEQLMLQDLRDAKIVNI